jgi:hypothetical protein
VTILRKKRSELTDGDYAHMQKVAGYVQRHLAQGVPDEGVETSRWHFSLENWATIP